MACKPSVHEHWTLPTESVFGYGDGGMDRVRGLACGASLAFAVGCGGSVGGSPSTSDAGGDAARADAGIDAMAPMDAHAEAMSAPPRDGGETEGGTFVCPYPPALGCESSSDPPGPTCNLATEYCFTDPCSNTPECLPIPSNCLQDPSCVCIFPGLAEGAPTSQSGYGCYGEAGTGIVEWNSE
jgi:hypothetical protein